jgi:hypothetical protein
VHVSTYEYMTVPLNHQPGLIGGPTIGATLNALADEGWRLIQVLEKHHYPPLGILERSTEWVDSREPEVGEERHEYVPNHNCDTHCALVHCGQDREHPVHEFQEPVAP